MHLVHTPWIPMGPILISNHYGFEIYYHFGKHPFLVTTQTLAKQFKVLIRKVGLIIKVNRVQDPLALLLAQVNVQWQVIVLKKHPRR